MKPAVSVSGFRKNPNVVSLVEKDFMKDLAETLLKTIVPKEKVSTVEITKELLSQIRDRIDLNQSVNFGRGQKKGR
jgi:hypothetical protein